MNISQIVIFNRKLHYRNKICKTKQGQNRYENKSVAGQAKCLSVYEKSKCV